MRLDEIEKELATSPRKNKIPVGEPLPADSPQHGTLNGYRFHACRCPSCREAHTEYKKKWLKRRKLAGELELPADSPIHGTVNGYNNYLCRCDRCRAANTAEKRAQRARKRQRAVNASGEGGNHPVGKVQARTAR